MAKVMTTEELGAFYKNLSALVAEGKEGDAEEYLNHHLPILPEELRQEILGRKFFKALVDEAEETVAVVQAQEASLAAAEALLEERKKLENKAETP